MTKPQKAASAALFANTIYGFSFMFSKIALEISDISVLLAVRFLIAFAILNVLWATGLIKMNFKGKKPGGLLAMGLLQPFLYFIFEQYGIIKSSSAIAGVIIALVPIAATGLAWLFLKEKPNLRQFICALVSLAGVVIISVNGSENGEFSFVGILLLLGAVLCAAGFNILSRYEAGSFTAFERTYVMMALGSVGFTVMAVVQYGISLFSVAADALCQPAFLVSVLYLSVLSSVVAFASYNYATTHLTTMRATSFSNIITVLSVLAGVFILKEQFSVLQAVAVVIIIIGVIGVNKK